MTCLLSCPSTQDIPMCALHLKGCGNLCGMYYTCHHLSPYCREHWQKKGAVACMECDEADDDNKVVQIRDPYRV